MAETKKNYVVAPGASFVAKNKTYQEGDAIDESAFKDKERFKKFLTMKPPRIIEAPAKEKEETKPKGGGSGGGNAGAGNTGGGNKLDRKALEELALKDGWKKPEEIKNLKDDELEKLLRDAGKLK